jgi:hypothetical protein
MTANEIIEAILTRGNVFLHYTDADGLSSILHQGVIRTNMKGAIYLTQEPISQQTAHTNLFIGATTHAGRGSHLMVLRLDSGVPVERTGYLEFCVRQTLRLDQHVVLFSGENPF